MQCTIFDLDNCVADDGWRIPMIDWSKSVAEGRYDKYHALSSLDTPHNVGLVDSSLNPVFLTARPVMFYPQTQAWIRKHFGIQRPTIIMRNNDDHRPSPELKASQLSALLGGDYLFTNVAIAYDDRDDIVRMYRDHGVRAMQVAIHDVCAYTPPQPPQPLRAPDHMERGAATFRQRNAVYGDNYLEFGRVMVGAFPDGLHINAGDAASFNRLGIFIQCASKLTRYSQNLAKGGHADSAHDLMVYASMLEEVTE